LLLRKLDHEIDVVFAVGEFGHGLAQEIEHAAEGGFAEFHLRHDHRGELLFLIVALGRLGLATWIMRR